MEALRDEVAKAEGSFHITKNTLLKIALEQTNHPVPEEILKGKLPLVLRLVKCQPWLKL